MNVSPIAPSIAPRAPATPPAPQTVQSAADASAGGAPAPAAASAQAPQILLLRSELTIEFDNAAERFVQTFTDPISQSVLRRFPAENQLAFSRGVNAYMAAVSRA